MKKDATSISSLLRTQTFRIVLILLVVAAVALTVLIAPRALERVESIVTTGPPPPTPSAIDRFKTLPPGATLPSEAECASRVRRSPWEPRPDNLTANHRVPTAQQIAGLVPWNAANGLDPRADSLRRQITGNFTGTTDEILQWVACKWGIDEDIVRAEAVVESHWYQSQLGDNTNARSLCPPASGYPGAWDGSSCYQSYGILQIKYIYNTTAWPMSRDDTAFNAEYMYGLIRTCYEGWTTYLHQRPPLPGYPPYHAGDIWGCVGRWYSGNWYDQPAIDYINKVKTALANQDWLQLGF
jgi:hypothetical protein